MGRRIAELSESEKTEICQLYAAGDPVAEIGAAYGLTGGTVSAVAKIAGMPARQRRAARALEDATFDPEKLRVEEFEGEPRVVDTVLGAALGYERPRAVRQLIERYAGQLRELDGLPSRATARGAGNRETDEYLLSQIQVNFLITRCGLPRADEWCIHIARVFTAWQEGRLQAVDYETAVEIEDSREAAEEEAPELAAISDELIQAVLDRAYTGARDGALNAIRELGLGKKRIGPSEDTKRQHVETVIQRFAGMCPCCGERRAVALDGTVIGQVDHWTDDRSKNGAHQTWLIAAECNQDFQNKKKLRHEYSDAFNVYQKRREANRLPLLSRN